MGIEKLNPNQFNNSTCSLQVQLVSRLCLSLGASRNEDLKIRAQTEWFWLAAGSSQ